MINQLANFLTLLSLMSAFTSLIFTLEQHFTFAAWAIIISVILDGLDGQVAKRIRIHSDFGKELDSLVDVIAFGIAPSLLGYIFIYHDFYFGAAAALFVYLISSVVRLAKYNITPKEKLTNYFYGLPTTISGGILATFILIFRKKEGELMPGYVPYVFIVLVFFLALLMLSKIKYLNIGGLRQTLGKSFLLIFSLSVLLIIVAAFSRKMGVASFSLFALYVLFSPFLLKKSV